jgi:CheY-like chemotaxis protein
MNAAPRVMVVERDAALRMRYGELLRGAGYRVVLAQDGTQALERLASDAAPEGVLLARPQRATAEHAFLEHLLTECPATAVVLRQAGESLWGDFAAWGADGCVGPLADPTQLERAVAAALRVKRAPHRPQPAGARHAREGKTLDPRASARIGSLSDLLQP